MNATELMAALDTVEQDHQLILDKMTGLKEVVVCMLEPATNCHAALDRLGELNAYFATAFEAHMQEEEVTLFPVLQKNGPDSVALVGRLLDQHTEIRHRLEEFAKCLYVADETVDNLQKMVVRDLVAFGWELWQTLDEHARLETQAVRRCMNGYFGTETVKLNVSGSAHEA